jgi:hypothetical protein
MQFRKISDTYFKNNMKTINKICEQSADLFNVKDLVHIVCFEELKKFW